MARKRRVEDQPIGVGMTAKQMKRKKPIGLELMRDIEPLTDNQKILFDSYKKEKHLVAYGCAVQVKLLSRFTMLLGMY